jgi:glycosyltransferase involved in cell wall biosynthesis
MMHRPRVLMVTGYTPYAPVSGGRTRTLGLLESLAGQVDVTLVSLARPEELSEDMGRLRRTCELVLVPRPASPTMLQAAGMSLRSPAPFTVQVYRSPALQRTLHQLLSPSRFDLVHVESFYLLQNLPYPCPVPVLLVDSAIEYVAWGRHARAGRPWWQRPGFAIEAIKTRRVEAAAWRRADAVGVVSEVDRAIVERVTPGVPVFVTPNGVDADRFRPGAVARSQRVGLFVGDYKYFPNVDAARRLARSITPAIRRRFPDFVMRLVGKDPPDSVRALSGRGVEVTGAVADVVPSLTTAAVFVSPLSSGSGTRTKLLEAMAAGCPIVTTRTSAEGLDLQDGRDALFAETDREIADAVAMLLSQPERAAALARHARETCGRRYSWDVSARLHLTAYHQVRAMR